MPNIGIAARTWTPDFGSKTTSTSSEIVILFSLLGLAASFALLLASAPQTVAAITAALMQ